MRRALIGYSGFVGGALFEASDFSAGFNSQNIGDIAGQHFDEIICAGIPAVKWLANKEPERDRNTIGALLASLETVRADRFVLVSTIDVYPDPSRPLTEDDEPNGSLNHAYGRHRLDAEAWVTKRFADRLIVRLPALFGPGLKKNVLFDLLHSNQVNRIDPASEFQWYPLLRLSADLALARSAGLQLVNFFTEPLKTQEILERFFPNVHVGAPSLKPVVYRLQSRHAAVFGGPPGYVMDRSQVLDGMESFITAERNAMA